MTQTLSPPMDALKSKLENLSTEQRAELLRRIKGNPSERSDNGLALKTKASFSLKPADRYKPFPLTDVQEAYWVGRRQGFDFGEVAAHGYMELECQDLQVNRLEDAWCHLIERHDMLRAIVQSDGMQRVLKEVPRYRINETDLRQRNEQASRESLLCTREEMSHQVFDTEVWPLFDLRVSRINEKVTRLHISLDVLILDTWSLDLLSRELDILYHQPNTDLPALELTFRDYILNTGSAESTSYDRAEQYWLQRIPELPPAPDLPVASTPIKAGRPQFNRRTSCLEPQAWSMFQANCGRFGVTPSVALLTAYAAVLSNWSSNDHFSLNLTLFNRSPLHSQVNDIVGDFTSVMLLEVDLRSPIAFFDRVKSVQQQLWRDIDHRQYSGIRTIRELARQRGANASTSMPVVFTSAIGQSESTMPFTWAGKEIFTITQTPQVWLDNQIAQYDGRLVFDWDSVDEVFPPGLLDDMFNSYCSLLQDLAGSTERWQESELLLTPGAHQQLVESANTTQAPVPCGLLHSPFMEQAQKNPETIAVFDGEIQISFGELDRLSNRIAHYLQQQGVKPNQLVAVVMEKCWQQVAAVLGISKSGAAYVPIDPDLPYERCVKLLEQAEVSLVLCQEVLLDEFNWPGWIAPITLTHSLISKQADDPPPAVAKPTDLAYVIFTSGSTGMPKGVMIDHRGALNTLMDINQRLKVSAGDKVLAISALNFDLSVYDIFGVLAAGGAVVMPSAASRLDTEHWKSLIELHQITLWNSVPTLFELLVNAIGSGEESRISSLRQVMMSGDWIPVDLPERCKQKLPRVSLLSLGGATEASIWSVTYPIEELDPHAKSIPYGKAMLNQSLQVMHENGHLCPLWVPGEIHIGGIGLALGYWRDKSKTDISFSLHPHTGERLYRTGDLGRLLPSGDIEFLGRKDFQVKVQGHRIELGEIESTLQQHVDVASALVTTVGDQKGAKRLVAYVVPQKVPVGQQPTHSEEGVILDPTMRLQFRMARHGVRQDLNSQSVIQLKAPNANAAQSTEYLNRRSCREFTSEVISQQKLSDVLLCLYAIQQEGTQKYRYGSAGGLYPVQTYVYIKPQRVSDIPGGIYYYHPLEHRLCAVNTDARIEATMHDEYNRPAYEQSAFSVFLIAQMNAIHPAYGHFSRDFCLLEAGLMCQLLESTSAKHDIGFCQIGALEFNRLESLFGLDEGHCYLHSLIAGPIDHAKRKQAPQKFPATTQSLDEKLQEFLRSRLPHYMIPSVFVKLDSLPLTSNGKVDRKALPSPDMDLLEKQSQFVEPSSALEKTIANVWREVLKNEKVGVEDSFFDLGGNSVQMVQVHNQLKALLNTNLNIIEMFFNYPSIRALARTLSGNEEDTNAASKLGRSSGEQRRTARKRRNRGSEPHSNDK